MAGIVGIACHGPWRARHSPGPSCRPRLQIRQIPLDCGHGLQARQLQQGAKLGWKGMDEIGSSETGGGVIQPAGGISLALSLKLKS